jgi:poly(3-hydroxybutyrate) depolymerase
MKNSYILFILAVMVILLSCARLQNSADSAVPNPTLDVSGKTGSLLDTISVNGTARNYRLYVPGGYQSSSPAVLVINFQWQAPITCGRTDALPVCAGDCLSWDHR